MKRMIVAATEVDVFDKLWDLASLVDEKVYQAGFNGYRTEQERVDRNFKYLEEIEKRSGMFNSVINKATEEELIEFADDLENANYHGFLAAFVKYLGDKGITLGRHTGWKYDFEVNPDMLKYER